MKITLVVLLITLGHCLVLLTGAAGSAHAQGGAGSTRAKSGDSHAPGSNELRIQKIRATFERINRDSTLNEVEADYDAEFLGNNPSDNGVRLKGYFKKDTLYKMVYEYGPSYGLVTYEYYFDKGKPVFVFEVEKRFPPDKGGSGLNYNKLVWGFEGRYYFDKGKLIAKVLKGKKFGKIDNEYIKGILDIRDDRKYLRKALHSKRPRRSGSGRSTR